jgi:hypothetical protein
METVETNEVDCDPCEEIANSINLWKTAVSVANCTDDERDQLFTWDYEAINGIQWSKGGIEAIQNSVDAIQAVNETLNFMRQPTYEFV